MYDRRLVAGGAAIALMALAILAVIVVVPRWSASGLDALARQHLGRSVTAKGGAHLDLSPLAIRLDDAVLSGPQDDSDSFVTAASAVIPVSLGQLLGGAADPSVMTLSGAEFALLIDERGNANWDFPGFAPSGPLHITLEQARFRYFDARNDQALSLGPVDGLLDIRADGGAAFAGTAVINDRLVKVDADLKSLARINGDGSPLELALSAREGSASFSGRLATAEVLSLVGPVSLASDTPGPALRLIGLPLLEGAGIAGPLAIEGGLDTAGRAYAIRNATVALGAFRAVGDLAADLRNEVPKLQGNLTADKVWLDGLVPAAGATDLDWGRKALPFAALRTLDAEVNIASRSLAYGDVTTGGASLAVKLAGGKLDLGILADLDADGSLNVNLKADAGTLPPSLSLSLDAQNTAVQPLLGALTGARQITGDGSFSADVSATGTTQEELAGTLKGTASFGIANGRIERVDLTSLFLAASQKILEGWSAAPGGTPFTSLNGSATIEDGIMTFRDVKLEAPDLSVSLEGIVDLLRQGIAVSASASSNGQPLLAVPVIARGLWASPKIYPDVADILANPEAGFARLRQLSPLQAN